MTSEEAYRINRALLCERTGWSLEYVDNLKARDYHETLEIFRARDLARNHLQDRANRKGQRMSGRR